MADMWMVRAGENAFLIDDFKELNIIAIGWEIGDLSGKSPDEIKELMANRYPDASKTSLGLNSAQVIKFACDFEIGDFVISYNPQTRNYLVGKIISDYYYSDKLSKMHNGGDEFYHHLRDVEWIGESNKDVLSDTALKPLKSSMTIFNLYDSAKNNILYSMNPSEIKWTDFYMEFADRLREYKDNRIELINKIQNVFIDLGMNLPTLERDVDGNDITPFDIDPFTIFALFNKQISAESRMNILEQIKKEFSLENKPPITFHGIATVNNLKAAFYTFSDTRGEKDIDNLWNLFESALDFSRDDNSDNYNQFVNSYNIAQSQDRVKWNITMALNWIRPFTFINLDTNTRNMLSTDEIFSQEFKNEIKSLKSPPSGEQYLKICQDCQSVIDNSEKYSNFPELSHGAYLTNTTNPEDGPDGGIGDSDIKTTHYWLYSPGHGAEMWDEFYKKGTAFAVP